MKCSPKKKNILFILLPCHLFEGRVSRQFFIPLFQPVDRSQYTIPTRNARMPNGSFVSSSIIGGLYRESQKKHAVESRRSVMGERWGQNILYKFTEVYTKKEIEGDGKMYSPRFYWLKHTPTASNHVKPDNDVMRIWNFKCLKVCVSTGTAKKERKEGGRKKIFLRLIQE